MKVTVLGCGSSLGTPAAGGFWGTCDPENSKNERARASIMVQTEKTSLLIDASYDLRYQLNRVGLKDIDGLLISHAHSDHVNGIDDVRVLAYHNNKMIDVYSNRETLDEIDRRWPYLFKSSGNGIYVQSFERKEVGNFDKFRIGDIDIETFEQDHTTCTSLGFRFGKFAYSVDVANLEKKSLEKLKGIETWIVDASSYNKETVMTHANLKRVKEWVSILKPKMTYITVLTTHMDYQTLCDELPPHIRPAYDGLVIDIDGNQR
jgi:phosphoribosyl 1,2-cyclic phosphate phosphodiesterase